MDIYTVKVRRRVDAYEDLILDVAADTIDEAEDLAYDIATTYPHSDRIVDRLRIVDRDYLRIDEIDVEVTDIDSEAA